MLWRKDVSLSLRSMSVHHMDIWVEEGFLKND